MTNKVIGILQAFTLRNGQLTLSQVADLAGLPPTTALRLLRELAEAGIVERTDHGNYRIGVGLWQVGELSVRTRNLREAAAPVIFELGRSMQVGVQVVIHEQDQPIVVDKLGDRLSSPPDWPRIAGVAPYHASAAGKLALAILPESARAAVLGSELRRFTKRTATTAPLVLRELDRTTARGFSLSTGELREGWTSMAAYIHDAQRVPVGSLAVGTRSQSFRQGPLLSSLRHAAEMIESRLAARG